MDMRSEESDHRRNHLRSTTSEEPDSTSVTRTFMLWLVRLFYPAFYATKRMISKVQILFSNHKQG